MSQRDSHEDIAAAAADAQISIVVGRIKLLGYKLPSEDELAQFVHAFLALNTAFFKSGWNIM